LALSHTVTHIQARRWRAAGALVAGGALAIGGTFLPLGQAVYPAMSGEPASMFTDIPAHDLTLWLVEMLRTPYRLSVSTIIWAIFLWGAPSLLAAIGLALVWARRWRPTWRSVLAVLTLVALGAGFTALSCVGYLHPFFGSQGASRTLGYGPAVEFAGYLLALMGTRLLPAVSCAPR